MRLSLSLATLLALLPAAQADTFTVGPALEHDFPDIQPAIDAAAPGDTILVYGGLYSGFLVNKPLTIASAEALRPAIGALIEPFPEIRGIAEGERVLLVGIISLAGSGVNITDCDGLVVLHDLEIGSVLQSKIRKADNLLFSRFTDVSGVNANGLQWEVQKSGLWTVDSLLGPLDPISFVLGEIQQFTTLALDNTRLTCAGTIILGAGWEEDLFVPGGHGFASRGSTIELRRSIVAGGKGGNLPGGHGALLSAGSSMVSFGNASVLGGFDGSGTVQQEGADVSQTSTLELLPQFLPTLSANPPRLASGNIVLTFFGDPGATGTVLASPELVAPWTDPAIEGEFFLERDSMFSIGEIEMNEIGTAILTVPLSAGPLFKGGVAGVQWVAEGPGPATVSNPALVYRIPSTID